MHTIQCDEFEKIEIKEIVNRAQNGGMKFCVYGFGSVGRNFYESIIKILKIQIDYFCDKKIDVYNNSDIDLNKVIPLQELLELQEYCVVFVLLGRKNIDKAKRNLSRNKYLVLVSFLDIINDDYVMRSFFDIKEGNRKKSSVLNKKIAVFTCITGNYDVLCEPTVIEDLCDYYCITDDPTCKSNCYTMLNINDIVPKQIKTNKDKNRYIKAHGYSIFPNYDYSIYIDGNLQITGRISEFVSLIGKYGLAFHIHPWADDLYAEAVSMSVRGKVPYNDVKKTINYFWNQGMPRNYGMVECGVIVCEHKNPWGKMILSQWFENYNMGSAKRDQIYMAYTLWKNNVPVDGVDTLPGDLRNNGYFNMTSIHK